MQLATTVMQSSHVPMTHEEFQLLPRKSGWNYAYASGTAHITPAHQIVVMSLPIRPAQAQHAFRVRPLQAGDQAAMLEAFIGAFAPTMEYCDWTAADIQFSARDILRGFFTGRRGKPHTASRVASHKNQIAGAALLVTGAPGCAVLDIVFVSPAWQRRGVAQALIESAVNELHQEGIRTLYSAYVLGNESSKAWHHAVGFIEEPDLLLARTHFRNAQYELERMKRIGVGTDLNEYEREFEHWQRTVEKLEELAQQQGMQAVMPLLRYSRRG